MNPENWKAKEYMTFVLIHIAQADNEIQQEEIYKLASMLSPDRVVAMRSYITDLTLKEQYKIIQRNRERFYPGPLGKKNLLDAIEQLAKVDGQTTEIEEKAIAYLKEII